jgi:hypothetical protein
LPAPSIVRMEAEAAPHWHGAGSRRQPRGRRGRHRLFPATRLHGQTSCQRPRSAGTAHQRP